MKRAPRFGLDNVVRLADVNLDGCALCPAHERHYGRVYHDQARGRYIKIYHAPFPRLYAMMRRHREHICLLYTSPSPRDATLSRMPSSA